MCRYLRSSGAPLVATTRRPGALHPGRIYLDLSRPLDGWQPPPEVSTACIFAVVARVADCAADPIASAAINVDRTLALIDVLNERGVYALFLSTNQVFDGETPSVPPQAPTCPRSEYGRQKARAEALLRMRMERGAPIGILRLAKVVSPGMPLFRGADALRRGGRIHPFHDMVIAPAPSEIVASTIAALLRKRSRDVFQHSGPRDITYAEIGHHIADKAGADPGLVAPVSAAAGALPEGSTPRHTTLNTSRLREELALEVPQPGQAVDWAITGP